MRVVSWNVNGLRAALKNTGKDLKHFLDSLEADLICLQETKATKDQLDSSLYQTEGYNGYFSFCKVKAGYSGVVTFCRNSVTPLAAEEGLTGLLSSRQDTVGGQGEWSHFTDEELSAVDAEGRAVMTEHRCVCEGVEQRVVLVNVYCPRVDEENPERLAYKLSFYAALEERCRALHKEGKLVIAVGDYNCSRDAIDSAYIQDDPRLLKGSRSREWMQQFAVATPSSAPYPLVDSFRYLHPSCEKAYTCWSTVLDCRKTNYGTRIDYILISSGLVEYLSQAEVWAHVEGSDHCPVYAKLSLTVLPAPRPPSLCSCYFSELKQKTLSSFLSARPKPSVVGLPNESTDPPKLMDGGRKRSLVSSSSSSAKARKTSQSAGKGQTLLVNLFKKPDSKFESEVGSAETMVETLEQTRDGLGSNEDSCSSTETLTPQPDPPPPSVLPPSRLSEEWQGVFSGPPKPPVCKGHSEPCVLRTVKKAGPNRNKQFWSCARPGGSKGDREAKCNFFKWATNTKLGKVKLSTITDGSR